MLVLRGMLRAYDDALRVRLRILVFYRKMNLIALLHIVAGCSNLELLYEFGHLDDVGHVEDPVGTIFN